MNEHAWEVFYKGALFRNVAYSWDGKTITGTAIAHNGDFVKVQLPDGNTFKDLVSNWERAEGWQCEHCYSLNHAKGNCIHCRKPRKPWNL